MPAREVIIATGLLIAGHTIADAQTSAPPLLFEKLAAECAPDVHPATLKGVVSTESAGNPYAIGVVGARLARQPRNLTEAVATARELERQGFNFSMGLGQVNRYNLSKFGERYETVFEPCRNLRAGSAILKDCYQRARARMPDDQKALRAAFSCYYSGNFTRGFRQDRVGQPSYVQKVVANATEAVPAIPIVPAVTPGDDAAGVEKTMGPAHAPTKRTARQAEWVIFADGPQQGSPVAEHPNNADKESAAKVRLATPTDGAAAERTSASARRLAAPSRRDPGAVPVQRTPSSINQQDAPFVQFVN